jgi:hypothetical protein
LCGVGIPYRKKGAGIQDREVKSGAARKLAHVHVSTENARRTRPELTIRTWRDTHDSTERAKRNDGRNERPGDFAFERPQEKKGLGEPVFQKSEALHHARPSPAFVRYLYDVYLEHVARLGSFHEDRTRERVDASTIDLQVFRQRHFWMNLRPAGVETLEMNRITGFDRKPRRQRAIPAGMRRSSRETVFSQRTLSD